MSRTYDPAFMEWWNQQTLSAKVALAVRVVKQDCAEGHSRDVETINRLREQVEQLSAACAQAAAERETWQPIETAPKDGTNFLACSPASSVFYAHWANGVVDSADWSDADGYRARHATVWQPLPDPV